MGKYKCPYCGSRKTRKSGINSKGQQRYFCNNCGKKSAEGVNYIKDKVCPLCGSIHIKKAGYDRYDNPRYFCNSCNKNFSDKTKEIHHGIICPKCKSTHIIKAGITANDKQRFRCKSCGRLFVLGGYKRKIITYKKTCPKCHNQESVKAGYYKGKSYYKCTICGYRYIDEPTYNQPTEQVLLQTQGMYRVGVKKRAIARMLNVSVHFVQKATKGMKVLNLKERIVMALKDGKLIKRIAQELNTTTVYVRQIMKNELEPINLTEHEKSIIIEFSRIFRLSRNQIRNLIPLNVVDREQLLVKMEN